MDALPTTPLGFAIALAFALVTLVWGMLRSQNSEQDKRITKTEAENVEQAKDIARLKERMIAREEVHEQHRTLIEGRLSAIDTKLDRLIDKLIAPRTSSSSAGRYGFTDKEGK